MPPHKTVTVGTGIRLPKDTHERLAAAAADRRLSVNWLVNRAIEDYLARLLPADEMKLTQ